MANSQAACQSAWQDRLAPCGTPAAARRHYRRHEPLDAACIQANRDDIARRAGRPQDDAGKRSTPLSAVRNGLPIVDYRWRERRYPWARRVLAAAEAVYGTPDQDQAVAS